MRRSASAGKASARTAADQRPPLLPPGVPPHAAEPLMSHCCSSKRCWRQATLTFERQPSTGSTVMRGEWASMGLQAAVEAIQAGLPACCHMAHGAPEHAPLEPPPENQLVSLWPPPSSLLHHPHFGLHQHGIGGPARERPCPARAPAATARPAMGPPAGLFLPADGSATSAAWVGGLGSSSATAMQPCATARRHEVARPAGEAVRQAVHAHCLADAVGDATLPCTAHRCVSAGRPCQAARQARDGAPVRWRATQRAALILLHRRRRVGACPCAAGCCSVCLWAGGAPLRCPCSCHECASSARGPP